MKSKLARLTSFWHRSDCMRGLGVTGCFRLIGCSKEEMLEAGGDDGDIDGGGFVRVITAFSTKTSSTLIFSNFKFILVGRFQIPIVIISDY